VLVGGLPLLRSGTSSSAPPLASNNNNNNNNSLVIVNNSSISVINNISISYNNHAAVVDHHHDHPNDRHHHHSNGPSSILRSVVANDAEEDVDNDEDINNNNNNDVLGTFRGNRPAAVQTAPDIPKRMALAQHVYSAPEDSATPDPDAPEPTDDEPFEVENRAFVRSHTHTHTRRGGYVAKTNTFHFDDQCLQGQNLNYAAIKDGMAHDSPLLSMNNLHSENMLRTPVRITTSSTSVSLPRSQQTVYETTHLVFTVPLFDLENCEKEFWESEAQRDINDECWKLKVYYHGFNSQDSVSVYLLGTSMFFLYAVSLPFFAPRKKCALKIQANN